MSEITIQENYVLPSKGLVYGDRKVNPNVRLKSATTAHEMRRLAKSDTPYKTMCDIIEECLINKEELGISVYDLCIGDYEFLLHKLRVVTYGPEYRMAYICPRCGTKQEAVINLDNLVYKEYTDDYEQAKEVTLPKSKKVVKLKVQTPRLLDSIALRVKELKKKYQLINTEIGYLVTLMTIIDTIDNVRPNPLELEEFCKKMDMKDANELIQRAGMLNEKVGLDNQVATVCSFCCREIITPFCIYEEFYGPEVHQ